MFPAHLLEDTHLYVHVHCTCTCMYPVHMYTVCMTMYVLYYVMYMYNNYMPPFFQLFLSPSVAFINTTTNLCVNGETLHCVHGVLCTYSDTQKISNMDEYVFCNIHVHVYYKFCVYLHMLLPMPVNLLCSKWTLMHCTLMSGSIGHLIMSKPPKSSACITYYGI